MDKKFILVCGSSIAGLVGLLFFDQIAKNKSAQERNKEKVKDNEKSIKEKLDNIHNKINGLTIQEVVPKKEVKKVIKKVDKVVKPVVADE